MTPPLAPPALAAVELTPEQFSTIGRLLYHVAGIHLHAGKEGLVRSRLSHRLRALSLDGFDAYLRHLEQDTSGSELTHLMDALTTNKTSFFREPEHFALLQREVLPALARERRSIRVWSAGCSSGEEPFTAAIVARETLGDSPPVDVKILATDISTRMLRRAREATYRAHELRDAPPNVLRRHFTRAGAGDAFRVVDDTRSLVGFARLNLMAPWRMRGPMDVIFCRNVMIYFDRDTQQRLVQRFATLLAPGGWLLVGHSESLTGLTQDLQYVQPAVYRKST